MISDQLANSYLDASQKTFCSKTVKSIRLLAPAGSGKTHSLLWRCLNHTLIAKDQSPKFLLFTFTRAARDELKDRLKNDETFAALRPFTEITTLNSWGFRRVKARKHSLRMCATRKDRYICMNNTLQPIWQKYPAIKAVITSSKTGPRATRAIMDLMDLLKGMGFRHDKHSRIDAFSNHVKWLESNGLKGHVEGFFKVLDDLEIIDIRSKKKTPTDQAAENFMGFWAKACARMFETSTITLEDQKYWAFIDLDQSLSDRKFTTGMHRINHILVDEFQDINVLDLNLLKTIAALNKCELTVAGDDDQAIYEWRGATPEFILNPDVHVGNGYQTCLLEINYRSPANIVEHSQSLIKHNKRRVPKKISAYSSNEAEILVLKMDTLSDSVEYVLNSVKKMLESPRFDRVAIIGRKRSQIIPYQIVFASQNIPFYAAEDLQLFLSEAFEELKNILAIKARATMSPPMIGIDVVEDLLKLCDKIKRFPIKKSDREALRSFLVKQRPRNLRDAIESFYGYRGPLKGENANGEMTVNFFEALNVLLKARTVSQSIESISLNFDGLQKDYGKSLDDIFYTDPPFLYLSDYAQRYGDDFNGFYYDIEKAIDTLAKIPPEYEEDIDPEPSWKLPLHLMTALRAKGKEFDAVIILDCNDKIWPSKLAITPEQLEQERRVFYVAFTRAKKKLILLVNDSMLGEVAFPSPYIQELGLHL